MKRLGYWLGTLAALVAAPTAAKVDDPNDLIRGRWYATEVIVFERAGPADPGPEELAWERGRTWPTRVRAFAEANPWDLADLDPLTRACLEFPRLQVAPPTMAPIQSPEAAQADGEVVEPLHSAEVEPISPVDGEAGQLGLESPGIQPLEADLGTMPPDSLVPLEPVATVPPPPIEPRVSPHPLLNLLSAAARQQEAQRRESYRWLPAQTHVLKTEARRLRRAGGLSVIWHGRWIQPVPSRSAGEPLMLAVQSAPSPSRLSGTLQVTLGRYLHFDARLWLEQPLRSPAATVPYMQLKQARTMRSGELHYLDHPRIGVLVRIDPLPPSPALVQALQAWEASAGG